MAGLIRVVVFIFTIVTMWVFLRSYTSFSRKTIRLPRWLGITPKDIHAVPMRVLCSLPRDPEVQVWAQQDLPKQLFCI